MTESWVNCQRGALGSFSCTSFCDNEPHHQSRQGTRGLCRRMVVEPYLHLLFARLMSSSFGRFKLEHMRRAKLGRRKTEHTLPSLYVHTSSASHQQAANKTSWKPLAVIPYSVSALSP